MFSQAIHFCVFIKNAYPNRYPSVFLYESKNVILLCFLNLVAKIFIILVDKHNFYT
jgi:hypothetical protein